MLKLLNIQPQQHFLAEQLVHRRSWARHRAMKSSAGTVVEPEMEGAMEQAPTQVRGRVHQAENVLLGAIHHWQS